MKLNLDTLKNDILKELEAQSFVVFHGFCNHPESRPVAYWDARRRQDYQAFLATASQNGVKMLVFHCIQFNSTMAEGALDQLEECELPPEEKHSFERKLREMAEYHGFTCSLELSYDLEGCTYVYEVIAEWYSDFLHILDEIDASSPEDDEEEDEESMGGYFSRN
jgi:hypothetical protein